MKEIICKSISKYWHLLLKKETVSSLETSSFEQEWYLEQNLIMQVLCKESNFSYILDLGDWLKALYLVNDNVVSYKYHVINNYLAT